MKKKRIKDELIKKYKKIVFLETAGLGVVLFICLLVMPSIIIFNYYKVYDGKTDNQITLNESKDDYILDAFVEDKEEDNESLDDKNNNLEEELLIDYNITSSILNYNSTIINADSKQITINELVPYNKIDIFIDKIEELIDLKFPTFITEYLHEESTKKVYVLNDYYIDLNFEFLLEDEKRELSLKIYNNEVKNLLRETPKTLSNYTNESGYNEDSTKKQIAITFDDGPHPSYTNELLKILEDNKAKSTFFMLGLNVQLYPDVVKNVSDSGNEIALHGHSHTSFTRMNLTNILEEIEQTNKAIEKITNKTTTLVRPPYGSINSEIKTKIDYSYILWNIDTNDWKTRDVDTIVAHVLEEVHDGCIILFHDIFKSSIEAVEILLPILYLEGYQFVDVTTLAKRNGNIISLNEIYTSLKK